MFFHRFAVVSFDRTGQRLCRADRKQTRGVAADERRQCAKRILLTKTAARQLIDALLHECADQIARRGAGRMIERLDLCIDGLHRAAAALQLRFPCRDGAFFALQTEKSIRKFPVRIVPAADGKKRMDGKTERTCLFNAGKCVPGRECAAAMTYLFA